VLKHKFYGKNGKMLSESSGNNRKDFYALINILIDDFKKNQSISNFAKTFIRLLKAIRIYYKKINEPKI